MEEDFAYRFDVGLDFNVTVDVDATTTTTAMQSSSESTGVPAAVGRRELLVTTLHPATCTGSGFRWTCVFYRFESESESSVGIFRLSWILWYLGDGW